MSPRPAKKAHKNKVKPLPLVVCPVSLSDKRAVEKRAYGAGLDVAKWLRRLIHRELANPEKVA